MNEKEFLRGFITHLESVAGRTIDTVNVTEAQVEYLITEYLAYHHSQYQRVEFKLLDDQLPPYDSGPRRKRGLDNEENDSPD